MDMASPSQSATRELGRVHHRWVPEKEMGDRNEPQFNKTYERSIPDSEGPAVIAGKSSSVLRLSPRTILSKVTTHRRGELVFRVPHVTLSLPLCDRFHFVLGALSLDRGYHRIYQNER